MPVAVDSTSPIHGFGEDADGVDTKHVSPTSQKLIRTARQLTPDARSDLDAVFTYLDKVGQRTQDNYREVNNILRQLDPLSSELDRTERELDDVEKINRDQQQLLGRLKARLDKTGVDQAPAQAQAQQQASTDSAERNAINKQLDQTPASTTVVKNITQTDPNVQQRLDQLGGQVHKLNAKDIMRTLKEPSAVSKDAKQSIVRQGGANLVNTVGHKDDQLKQLAANELNEDITEDVYESRLYKMKLAGYFD